MKQRFVGKDKNHTSNDKDQVFNAILALYAGEDLDIVIEQLDSFADQYPDEVGFYIPQLCTYLFHVSTGDLNETAQTVDTDRNSKLLMTPKITEESVDESAQMQTEKATCVKEQLRQFLLNRAKKSLKFAHLVFWYLLAGIDDSESVQLNQHRNPELWTFLKTLIQVCEDSDLYQASPILNTLGLDVH